MKKKQSPKERELLGMLSSPEEVQPQKPTEEKPTVAPEPALSSRVKAEQSVKTQLPTVKVQSKVKPTGFSLYPEDIKKIQELKMWLTAQGGKATDSTVVKCAIRLAEPGKDFLAAYEEIRRADKRLSKRKS